MPITINHPAAQEELLHLDETKRVIEQEQALSEGRRLRALDELAYAQAFDPDILPAREMIYSLAEHQHHNLGLALGKPYFTRIDFTEEQGDRQVYYIGKYGVLKSNSLEIQVVDWRSPIANLYYSGQIGPMQYTAPDGAVRGELTLKRQFGIERGELQTIFDTDVVSQDAYLQSVLGAMTGDRLREIVTTIQAEQNFVIRYPLGQTLVVQGVAGSGKTTIALHRIAYLLYAFEDRLMPEHMLILAPNPLFLNFIAGVLPDLGVERVWQTTFQRLIAGHLKSALPPVSPARPPEEILNLPNEERERIAVIAGVKGSIETGARLNAWLDEYELRFPPKGDISFGPVSIFTNEQLRKFLLVDEKPFPLNRRVSEIHKEIKRRVKEASASVCQWLIEETDRRAERLRQLPDGEIKREKLTRLYQSREERIQQAKDQVRPFIEETMKRFPKLNALDVYREFWNDMSIQAQEGSPLALTADEALTAMENGKIEPEDVALMAMVTLRLVELKRLDIRHIVIDEAQDFSPLEVQLLQELSHNASMTIVGDLMQGVRAWRGLNDWRELTEGIFHEKAVVHHLVTSYRNTVEIMNTALTVAGKHPTPGQQDAKPVLRHGPEPEFFQFTQANEQAERIEMLAADWLGEGMTTIAIVARTKKQLKDLAKRLPPELGATELNVDQAEYVGGVLLAQAADVKGFEFDGVIVADAGEEQYPDRALDARLLYVCLTRPLHRLAVLYRERITALLM